jgi:hypothetical protein
MTEDTRLIVASNLTIARAILQTHYLSRRGSPTIPEEKQVLGMFHWGYKAAANLSANLSAEETTT